MHFQLYFTDEAQNHLDALRETPAKAALLKQVEKTLGLMQVNMRHPSLRTHSYASLVNPIDRNEKVFEAYVQQNTPGAYRIFWTYGPGKGNITIIAITPHP